MGASNRYAEDWDRYSQRWSESIGAEHEHLGDEWSDVRRDDFYFAVYADRWLRPDMTVLEVGPGGGKFSVRLAPRVQRLIVLDVAKEMLKRTKKRCKAEGHRNVEYVLANGEDFQPVADASIDFFFSYDVFVHIALEDTWPYAQEMARVLKPGAVGACHHAVNTTPEAWNRIEQNNRWFRGAQNTLGQYYYHSPEALRRMYERTGLLVLEQHQEGPFCTCVFAKPDVDVACQLERLLSRLAGPDADDTQSRAELIAAVEALPRQLEESLRPVLERLRSEPDQVVRCDHAARIRRLWRGL
jgi:ubiquinone/menaquinone biosynthesis C-methylase UbiE